MSRDIVYRDYDQRSLDLEYDMKIRCAADTVEFERLKAVSDEIAHDYACHIDLRYGDQPGETVDVFPAGQPDAPIHVFIHGGYWRSMDKDMFRYLAALFVARGITLFLPNYDLCPSVTMDEVVRQNRACLGWIYRNAHQFQADPQRIFVSGHSAGGHLTAAMATTDWSSLGLPHDLVKGACAISGLFDLEPIRLSYLNEDLRMDEETAFRNSPIHNLPDTICDLIVAVGGGETDEFRRQSRTYVAALGEKGLPVRHEEVLDHNHIIVSTDMERTDNFLVQAIFGQMGMR